MVAKVIEIKNTFRKNGNAILKYVCLSMVIAFVLEFITTIDFSTMQYIKTNSEVPLKKYEVENLLLSDCIQTEDGIVTTGTDSWIMLKNVQDTVLYLEINLKKTVGHSWFLQVYYNTEQQLELTEENSIGQWISKYDKKIIIKLDKAVSDLRIDLGNESDTLFKIDTVQCNITVWDYLSDVILDVSIARVMLYSMCILLIFLVFVKKVDGALHILYRWRWAIGFALIAFCTIFKIHGSSMNIYSDVFVGYDYLPLLGKSREIRSDEFVVFTQMSFSQVADGFHWFNNCFRGTMTDMAMTYGQPIKNLIMVYRPFEIGYLLFGAERGLAFFWSSRFVFCFLVSLEFGKLLTKKNVPLSFAYAFLVALSPVVQWWFSVNGLVEMLVFGQGAVILLAKYIDNIDTRKRICYVIGLVICAGGYILCLYPAWQVPLFYVFLACAISVVIDRYKKIRVSKLDVGVLILGVLSLVLSMIYAILKSQDMILATMNTVYPGSRTILGGSLNNFSYLFKGWGNLFTANWSSELSEIALNQCEVATFFDFFPLGFVIVGIFFFHKKKKDSWLIILSIIDMMLIAFVLLPWHELLAKISLLSNCQPERVLIAVGLLNIMILIRAVSQNVNVAWKKICIPITCLVAYFSYQYYKSCFEQNTKILIIVIIAIACMVWCRNAKKEIMLICMIISLLAGGVVNPICQGADVWLDNPIVRQIAAVNTEEEGKWAVSTDTFVFNNLPTIVGASVINSVATYPNEEMWKNLGLEQKGEYWNRYLHFNLKISQEAMKEPELELLNGADYLSIKLDIDMLNKLDVKYILTNQWLEPDERLECMYSCEGYYIYKLL